MQLSVRETTGYLPISSLIQDSWLRFFEHVAQADSKQYHQRITAQSLEETMKTAKYNLAEED